MAVPPPPFVAEAHRVAIPIQKHDAREDEEPKEDAHYDSDGGVCARGGVPLAQLRPCRGSWWQA